MKMRRNLDNKLDNINKMILEMAMYTERAVDLSVDLLQNGDEEIAKQVIDYERKTDILEDDIKQAAYRVILEEQPVATDLRIVTSAIQIATDLERVGDQVRDISEIALDINRDGIQAYLDLIKDMATETTKILNDAINTFVHGDVEAAEQIEERDDIVDDLFIEVRDRVISGIRNEDLGGEGLIDVMMIAKYLERIGDHAVNISEWVEFIVEG